MRSSISVQLATPQEKSREKIKNAVRLPEDIQVSHLMEVLSTI